jgi:hypothetical protein
MWVDGGGLTTPPPLHSSDPSRTPLLPRSHHAPTFPLPTCRIQRPRPHTTQPFSCVSSTFESSLFPLSWLRIPFHSWMCGFQPTTIPPHTHNTHTHIASAHCACCVPATCTPYSRTVPGLQAGGSQLPRGRTSPTRDGHRVVCSGDTTCDQTGPRLEQPPPPTTTTTTKTTQLIETIKLGPVLYRMQVHTCHDAAIEFLRLAPRQTRTAWGCLFASKACGGRRYAARSSKRLYHTPKITQSTQGKHTQQQRDDNDVRKNVSLFPSPSTTRPHHPRNPPLLLSHTPVMHLRTAQSQD